MQAIKDYLVRQGPNSRLMRAALQLSARLRGFRVVFGNDKIRLQQGNREVVLSARHYIEVPFTMSNFAGYFQAFVPATADGHESLDFSQPGTHRYRRHDVGFEFPCIPEEDMLETFVHWYTPQPGDVVWDAGAHAGATSYFLAQMVGPEGRVYAFEPDEINYGYLLRNIASHRLTNVIPVKKALAGHSGEVTFHMDGTMAAGIPDYLTYSGQGRMVAVPAITFADACAELGVPAYVKMDIEGAEVAVIAAAQDFLKQHPVNFAIESDHRIHGEQTAKTLDRLFAQIGYEALSSDKFGQMFTWARRPQVTG